MNDHDSENNPCFGGAGDSSNDYVKLVIFRWICGGLFASLAFVLANQSALEDRVVEIREVLAEIKGNRFTSQDGYALLSRISKEYPPKWLLDLVNENKERIKKLEESNRSTK